MKTAVKKFNFPNLFLLQGLLLISVLSNKAVCIGLLTVVFLSIIGLFCSSWTAIRCSYPREDKKRGMRASCKVRNGIYYSYIVINGNYLVFYLALKCDL